MAQFFEVNLADQTVYPESFRMHNDTLNMRLCFKKDALRFMCFAGGQKGSIYSTFIWGRWFQIFFIFNPTWGSDPILTNIFQLG